MESFRKAKQQIGQELREGAEDTGYTSLASAPASSSATASSHLSHELQPLLNSSSSSIQYDSVSPQPPRYQPVQEPHASSRNQKAKEKSAGKGVATPLPSASTTSSTASQPLLYQPIQQTREQKTEVKTAEKINGITVPPSLEMTAVVTASTLSQTRDAKTRAQAIAAEFNQGVSPENRLIQPAALYRSATRVKPGEFLVGFMNGVPELYVGDGSRVAAKITDPYTNTGVLGPFEQNAPFFGAYGKFVLNVPQGQMAKAWSGNTPIMYGEGAHVISDPLFKFNPQNGFVKVTDKIIEHGNIRIVNLFTEYGLFTIDGKQVILPPRPQPYVFNTSNFHVDGYKNQQELFIQHGGTVIMNVPAGFIAKGWKGGSVPEFFEHQAEPYIIEGDPKFRLERASQHNLYERADAKLIELGAKKRIFTGPNQVAIINRAGKTEIVSGAVPIDDQTHTVVGFLDTGVQTVIFPSEKTRKQRELENRENKAGAQVSPNYETFNCLDMKIQGQIMLAYFIENPQKTIEKRLTTEEGIIDHLEGLAVADMGMVVQECTWQEVLSSSRRGDARDSAAVEKKDHDKQTESSPSAPPEPENYQTRVIARLTAELKQAGIGVMRLNLINILIPEEVSAQISKQAVNTASTSTQLALLLNQGKIATTQAEQAANKAGIEQKQKNESLISAAEAEFKAAENRANAKIAELKAVEEEAKLYGKYPWMLQLKLAEINARTFGRSDVHFNVTAEQFATTGFSLFAPQRSLPFSMPSSGLQSSATTPRHQELSVDGSTSSGSSSAVSVMRRSSSSTES